MKRTWLSDRISDVENASKRFEQSTPKPNCVHFLNAFEKQLHHHLHLKNFIGGPIFLPIEKGCYDDVRKLMEENGAIAIKSTYPKVKDCSRIILTMSDHKVAICPDT